MISVSDKILALIAAQEDWISRETIMSALPAYQHDTAKFALFRLAKTEQITPRWDGPHDPWYQMTPKQKAEFDSYMSPLAPYFAKHLSSLISQNA